MKNDELNDGHDKLLVELKSRILDEIEELFLENDVEVLKEVK